jgi:hypothetical protein
MSAKTKSIFSGMGGVIGAVAGLVTVAVGLLTIGSQTGWFGTDDAKPKSGTGQQATTGPQDADASTTSRVRFAATPSSVDFGLLSATEQVVSVENTGTVPSSFDEPTMGGSDPDEFKADDVSCAGRQLQPGGECRVRVEFTPTKAGTYSARMEIPVSGSDRFAEVALKANKPF